MSRFKAQVHRARKCSKPSTILLYYNNDYVTSKIFVHRQKMAEMALHIILAITCSWFCPLDVPTDHTLEV